MLQLSLDWMTLREAMETARSLQEYADIIEVGTPLLFDYGLDAVEQMKKACPGKAVLADMKIIDGGQGEVMMAVRRHADYITIMGAANDRTIEIATQAAHAHGVQVLVDLLGVADVRARALAVEALGVDYVCLHTAFDMRQLSDRPVEGLTQVKQVLTKAKTAIAGGITRNEIDQIMAARPDLVIVGGGILNAPDPAAAAKELYQKANA